MIARVFHKVKKFKDAHQWEIGQKIAMTYAEREGEKMSIPVISFKDLISNKKASGRPWDKHDLDLL